MWLGENIWDIVVQLINPMAFSSTQECRTYHIKRLVTTHGHTMDYNSNLGQYTEFTGEKTRGLAAGNTTGPNNALFYENAKFTVGVVMSPMTAWNTHVKHWGQHILSVHLLLWWPRFFGPTPLNPSQNIVENTCISRTSQTGWQVQDLCTRSGAATHQPLPAACPVGEHRGRVSGRVPGAARWFEWKRARHGADRCWSYVGHGGKKATGAHRRRFSGVTVTTFRKMKHEPTGGEVKGTDRRRRDIWNYFGLRPPRSDRLL